MTDSSVPQSTDATSGSQRWYDHEPLLMEALEILRQYQDELKTQAENFLSKIADEVGEAALEAYYREIIDSRGGKFGRRWYDKDPVLSKAVELLRVAPPEAQRRIAQGFLESIQSVGSLPETSQEEV